MIANRLNPCQGEGKRLFFRSLGQLGYTISFHWLRHTLSRPATRI
jgi:hypothetical protein